MNKALDWLENAQKKKSIWKNGSYITRYDNSQSYFISWNELWLQLRLWLRLLSLLLLLIVLSVVQWLLHSVATVLLVQLIKQDFSYSVSNMIPHLPRALFIYHIWMCTAHNVYVFGRMYLEHTKYMGFKQPPNANSNNSDPLWITTLWKINKITIIYCLSCPMSTARHMRARMQRRQSDSVRTTRRITRSNIVQSARVRQKEWKKETEITLKRGATVFPQSFIIKYCNINRVLYVYVHAHTHTAHSTHNRVHQWMTMYMKCYNAESMEWMCYRQPLILNVHDDDEILGVCERTHQTQNQFGFVKRIIEEETFFGQWRTGRVRARSHHRMQMRNA